MEANWIPRMVARHPYVIFVVIFVFSSMCLVIPLTTKKLPDFSDPEMGFEARGTVLSKRLQAYHNLIEATKGRGELTDNPLEYQQYIRQVNQQDNLKKKAKNKKGKKGKKHRTLLNDTGIKEIKDPWEELLILKNKPSINIEDNKNEDHLDGDSFFCNLPSSSYARVVIGVQSEEKDLWSMEGVLAQCHIDGVFRGNAHFSSLCQVTHDTHGTGEKCCRSWSPANYVALLSNRSSCLGVTENDLSRVKTLLQQCSHYYHNRQLLPNCAEDINCQKRIPAECYMRNAVYHLLHYLLDVDFVSNHEADEKNKTNSTSYKLQSVMLFLPVAASSATLDFYKAIDNDESLLTYGDFYVQGMQLGLKNTLFDQQLISDSSFVLATFIFITLCILAYTGSIILTVTTIITVLFSLGISFAMYTLVLRIHFFPFMNLLAIVVAVGIGADDAFVYCKIWESGKQQKLSDDDLTHLIKETMKHAFPSMFVTSFTTAVAFFASIVSNVTAINCFSLFAGMTVIANFFLMVTWLPACMVISERCRLTLISPMNFITRKIIRPVRSFGDKVTIKFTAFLIEIAIRLQWFWLLSLATIATICCIIVFRYPGLQLPDYINFQLFHHTHPFEQYDLIYSQRFWFERHEMIGGDAEILPLRFIWGIHPVDNGDYLNPNDKGTPDWDETFDISDQKSQVWLERFCRDLRTQPFYRNTMGPLLSNCFIDSLRSWMQRRCEDPIDPRISNVPCCENSRFPYKPNVLLQCAAEASAQIHRTPYLWIRDGAISAGLKFVKEPKLSSQSLNGTVANATKLTPVIKALVVEYDSTHPYTFSFADLDKFYHQVESWMQNQLRSAPKGMRNGFFVSSFEFYELQRALYEGTIWAIGVSLTLALIVLAFVTSNALISLYAIVTIGAVIIVTVAILILLGWKLDVLESVAVSTAIGLAVDFSLHYTVSYKACTSKERTDRVKMALQRMGGPTLMAAITSGAAGALMLPSHVLPYTQIGIFLLLIMSISWLYATLFLCPMLAIMGPLHFAQFKYSKLKMLFCFHKYNSDNSDVIETDKDNNRAKKICKGRGMLSESTLSTSSSACQFHCSELETLAVRPPSPSLPSSPLSTLLH